MSGSFQKIEAVFGLFQFPFGDGGLSKVIIGAETAREVEVVVNVIQSANDDPAIEFFPEKVKTSWLVPEGSFLLNEEQKKVLRSLIALARAAHSLADDAEDDGQVISCDPASFQTLSEALEALDDLPEIALNIYGTGPAKAEALLFPHLYR